jgi:hypothetical protein
MRTFSGFKNDAGDAYAVRHLQCKLFAGLVLSQSLHSVPAAAARCMVCLCTLTLHFDDPKDRRASGPAGCGPLLWRTKKWKWRRQMVREFEYRGETFRVTAHGIAGHEEIFIVHIEADGMEGGEISIDRMTEENDTSAPLQDIIIMLCDRLIPERGIAVSNPDGPFAWRQGNVQFAVHDGVQERH